MDPDKTPAQHLCGNCGGVMQSGPIGPQCIHCLLSFATADERFADVAGLFPELDIRELIANGGFGSVFRAEQRRMKRQVALKILDIGAMHSPGAVEMFEGEMVTVASLNHPGIVQAYDAGDREGQCYIVMELVDGLDCGALVRRHGRLPVAESCEIIRQAALALDSAHAKGLVHRDVKPGNLMLSRSPTAVKVLDFGLACIGVTPLIDETEAATAEQGERPFLGTLEYIAPEQISSPHEVDARADIYALGATLRRMLTGKPAREGMSDRTLMMQMEAVASDPIPPLSGLRPDLPAALANLCDRLIATERGERPATAAEVARLLEPWCAGAELERLFSEGPLPEKPFPSAPKRKRRIVTAVAAVASLALLAWIYQTLGKPVPPAPSAASYRPVFSAEIISRLQLDEAFSPRFLTDDWETEAVTTSDDQVDSGRILPNGDLVYRKMESNGFTTLRHSKGFNTEASETVSVVESGVTAVDVAPDTGHYIWTQRKEPDYRHLRRAMPDGALLAGLTFDAAGDFDPSKRATMRKHRERFEEEDEERRPVGFAFVTEGQVPENTGLSVGDVLIADEGDRWLGPVITLGLVNDHGLGGLWRCRFDNEEPADRLGEDEKLIKFPQDVAVARSGVFLLNRSRRIPESTVSEADSNRRILRWDKDGFHPCRTSQPIRDPSGIAADPLSTDLYVIEGALFPSASPGLQRLLRLRLTKLDTYGVEIVAERFGKLSPNGLAFSADGKRMVITDRGNRAIVLLRRKE